MKKLILQAKVTTVFALQELLICKNMEFRKNLSRVGLDIRVLKLSEFMSGLVLSNIERHGKPWQISLTYLQKNN